MIRSVDREDSLLVGIDVGGTFTDLVLYNTQTRSFSALKVPSNRDNPDKAIISALDKSDADPKCIGLIVHGTTVATNALLERRGSKVAFITTKGFRDVLELGRTTRLVPRTLYVPHFKKPKALVDRCDRYAVEERTESDGSITFDVNLIELENLARQLQSEGVEAVAIGFINSFKNPANELKAGKLFGAYFDYVSISTEVLNEIREFERFSVCVMNSYVQPVMARYVSALSNEIERRSKHTSFYTVGSNGGLLSTEAIKNQPVRSVLSGPAAGVAATIHLAKEINLENIITLDVGGTSSDVALIANSTFPLKRETIFEGMIIKLPQLDIHTVGAGGGSIASLDDGGGLQVGPESAGAVPGPAAYGRGGSLPTVTDANVVLERLGANQQMGGSLGIDYKKAVTAISNIATKAGITPENMAEAILRLAVAKIAAAVQEISAMRGHDPRDFALVSYGGAGPLHAALVAAEVGIKKVVIPPTPGAFSAFGTLCSPLTKDKSETVLRPMSADTLETARHINNKLSSKLRSEFENEKRSTKEIYFEMQMDMRYEGQAHEIIVSVDPALSLDQIIENFEKNFEKEYGRRDTGRVIELVNVRIIARLPVESPIWTEVKGGSGNPKENRQIYVSGKSHNVPIWAREDLTQDHAITGPAVIEEMSATTYVPASWFAKLGHVGELSLRRS